MTSPAQELTNGMYKASGRSDATTRLAGKCCAMVVFSSYPEDPRPRRAVSTLLAAGMTVQLLCEAKPGAPRREVAERLAITRIPLKHHRGGVLSYLYQYIGFTMIASMILLWRSIAHRYDVVYVHNMPDLLVFCSVVPKLLGAKVILDQHDPMPELMTALFGLEENSAAVRLVRTIERWSLRFSNRVITVNLRCKALFASRSCRAEKISVVMNTPDDAIFPFRSASTYPLKARSSGEPFVIMFHGSMVKRNGLGLAVSALARVLSSLPHAVLRVYGVATPFLEEVLREADALGVAHAVEYLGPKTLEQLADEIQTCDVGIIPNEWNTFTRLNTPTRIFEYLFLGKPVVAPDTPGITDYFSPGTLLFFEAGNVEQLAAAILGVHADPVTAAEVTARGQEICRRHNWRSERDLLVRVVADLVDPAKVAAPDSRTTETI